MELNEFGFDPKGSKRVQKGKQASKKGPTPERERKKVRDKKERDKEIKGVNKMK